MADAAGPLIIIGGHEDKEDQRVILKAVAERLNGGRLVIATVASHTREGYFDSYVSAFGALGVTDLAEGTDILDQLMEVTGQPAPAPLSGLKDKAVRFGRTVDKEDMALQVLELLDG